MASDASFNADATIGAFQIGVLVSYVLFGVTTTQMYIYYTRFPDDALKFKVLAAFTWVCELVHALCIGHTLYVWTISDYAHPERLVAAAPKSLDIAVLSSGGIAVCVQGFFAFRIYRFSRNKIIPIIILTMALFRLVGVTYLSATGLQMKSLGEYVAQSKWVATCVWSVSAANDLTITATLVFILHRERNNMHRRSAAIVDKLILWTLGGSVYISFLLTLIAAETGLLTSVMAIAELTFFVTMTGDCTSALRKYLPSTLIAFEVVWLAAFAVSSRLFSNSLLASLNSRATLRSMNEVSQMIPLPHLTPAVSVIFSASGPRLMRETQKELPTNNTETKSTPNVPGTDRRDKVVFDV